MQNTVQAAAFTPPMHIQPSTIVVEDGLLHFAGEHSIWTSKGAEPYIPHRNDSPLPFKVKRRRGHHRVHLHPVIFAALAAAAMAYLLLRCAQHLGVLQKPRCVLRSVVSREGDENGREAPCVLAEQGELVVVAMGGEALNEEQVHERVKRYTLELTSMINESENNLRLMPTILSVKMYSNLLRFCIVELSALCSLLEPTRRQPVEDVVDALKLKVVSIESMYSYKTTSRTRLRHIHCMYRYLWELPGMDFTATSMSTLERQSKLAQLLTLQEVALTQMQDGMRMLAEFCQQEAQLLPEEGEKERVDALYQTTDARRNHVLQDDVLGKWLRGKQTAGTHFGLAAPSVIESIIASSPKPYEELLEELRNTPLGLRQQQSNLRLMQQTGVEANIQDLGTPDPTTVSAGKLEAIRTSPKDLSSSEASVAEAAEPFGMATSAGHVPESLGAPGINASLGMLDLAVAARASGIARAGGASLSSDLGPLPPQPVLSLPSQVPAASEVMSSHRFPEEFSPSEASEPSAFPRVPLPSNWSEVYLPLVFSGVSATASSPKVSDSVKPSDLVTTAKRFWRSQALQPQVSGEFATHELDITPADAERPRSSATGWAFDTGGESSTPQMPLSHQPLGSPIWSEGASEAQTGLVSEGGDWLAEPEKQGLWSPHVPGSLLSRLTLPREMGGAFYYIQPSAKGHASGQFPVRLPGVASTWRLEDSQGSEAAVQSSPWESGTPARPFALSGRWKWPGMQAEEVFQGHSRPETSRVPFKGVAVGEPAGGIQEQDSTPAAHVAAALFSPNSADFSKGLLSPPPDSGFADWQ